MLIGELSAMTGVSRRLLRYYEEQGLLDAERGPNGYRVYDADAVRVVQRIRALLAMGLSTEVIATVLPCASGDLPELDLCPDLVRTLRRELDQIDSRIDTLQQSRSALAAYLPNV